LTRRAKRPGKKEVLTEGTDIAPPLGLGASASGKSRRWPFARAADVSPSPGGEGRGEVGLFH
jgi:hypothetical protein